MRDKLEVGDDMNETRTRARVEEICIGLGRIVTTLRDIDFHEVDELSLATYMTSLAIEVGHLYGTAEEVLFALDDSDVIASEESEDTTDKWIRVKDQLPEENTEVLVKVIEDNDPQYYIGYRSRGMWILQGFGSCETGVDYWQEIEDE